MGFGRDLGEITTSPRLHNPNLRKLQNSTKRQMSKDGLIVMPNESTDGPDESIDGPYMLVDHELTGVPDEQ